MSISTLRRWEKSVVLAAEKISNGHRRYDINNINPTLLHGIGNKRPKTFAYARVSSHDQNNDLKRQIQVLELYYAKQGWQFEIITVFSAHLYGSYSKKNKKLLEAVKVALA